MSLNSQQQSAVTCLNGPLLILAGAGSGKTTVLMNRISHMISAGIQPRNILAVTFTNKASNEMKERIHKLVGKHAHELWVSTFHSMCVRLLRNEINQIPLASNFSIYDTNDSKQLLKQVFSELNIPFKKGDPSSVKPEVFHSYISTLKNEMIDVDSFIKGIPMNNYIDEEKMHQCLDSISEDHLALLRLVYPLYEESLIKNNATDFDGLITHTLALLIDSSETLQKYQDRFHYIMVDEYQDTNRSQYVLVNLLAARRRNIAVVGDDYQSIYAFRGSDIRNILNFDLDYPDATVIKLEQNYRSTKTIIAAANQIISKNTNQKNKNLFTENQTGKPIHHISCFSPEDEASMISEEIFKLKKNGYSLDDIAILYRSNAQSGIIETILNRDGIPNYINGGTGFWGRAEILDLVAFLQFIHNPKSTIHFSRIANKPKRGIGDSTISKIMSEYNGNDFLAYLMGPLPFSKKACESLSSFGHEIFELVSSKETTTTSVLIQNLIKKFKFHDIFSKEDPFKQRDRKENTDQLVSIASEMESRLGRDVYLSEFMEEVILRNVPENGENHEGEKVTLMTIHASKGLEYQVVFIVGMNAGTFPAPYAESEEEKEEERRICYVSITRAKTLLYISTVRNKLHFQNGSAVRREAFPSPFMADIHPSLYIEKVR